MTFLSLNVRRLDRDERIRALSKVFSDTNPSIILLQETMCSTSIAIEIIANLLPSWEILVVSASGLSGGLLSCWNPRVAQLKSFKTN